MFALTWTAMHKIDETSPFYGPGAIDRLRADGSEIYVTLSGLDETMMQTISARYRYALDDIVDGARFADVLRVREDGVRVIDYDKFHDIVPLSNG
jgi:inward rectifier potassium channel